MRREPSASFPINISVSYGGEGHVKQHGAGESHRKTVTQKETNKSVATFWLNLKIACLFWTLLPIGKCQLVRCIQAMVIA